VLGERGYSHLVWGVEVFGAYIVTWCFVIVCGVTLGLCYSGSDKSLNGEGFGGRRCRSFASPGYTEFHF